LLLLLLLLLLCRVCTGSDIHKRLCIRTKKKM